jgi:hypothetical protein
MKLNPTVRALACERRCAAVHEAGHIVVANHFGASAAYGFIAPRTNAAPDERTWGGRATYYGIDRLPREALHAIAVAGVVAEAAWSLGGWVDIGDVDLTDMSETDRDLADCDDDALFDAVIVVANLLERGGNGWQALIVEARRLMIEARNREPELMDAATRALLQAQSTGGA